MEKPYVHSLLDSPTIVWACAATTPGSTSGSIRPVWITAQFMRQKASAPSIKISVNAVKTVLNDSILATERIQANEDLKPKRVTLVGI